MQATSLIVFCLVAAAAAASTRDPCWGLMHNPQKIDFAPAPAVVSPTVPFTTDLRPKVKTWADRFPALKRVIDRASDQSTVTAIKTITGRGFTYYSQEAALQAIESVDGNMYDQFKQYMLSTLEIPGGEIEESINSELFDIIQWADNSDWVQFSTTFTDAKLQTKYVCVLGHRNIASNTYDFVVADFKNSVLLAPDIMVVTERKSGLWGLWRTTKTKVITLPPSLRQEDLELVTNFFDLAAFSRFAKMLDVPIKTSEPEPAVDPATVIVAVNAGIEMWGKIAQTFKTTSTSRLVKEIMGEGFDFYVQRSTVQVIQGMNEDNMINRLVPILPRIFRLSTAEIIQDVQTAVCLAPLMDEGSFTKNDFLFNTNDDQKGDVRFADVIAQKQPNVDKFNLVLANVQQQFRMAPNLHIIENSKSYVGGIYEKTKIEYRRVPRGLTTKDMEVLMAFFHITTFKRIASHLNLEIKYPDPEIPK